MKVKIENATNDQLDRLVARIKGVELYRPSMYAGRCVPTDDSADFYSPSTDWSQGGPIIEREKIGVWPAERADKEGLWGARMLNTYITYGHTPLIAAMRCFVASKLGDEVEIPEELK